MTGTESSTLPPVATDAEGVGAQPGPLTREELARLLRLGSIELVGELWAVTQKQVDIEISRHARLDGKATSLLTAAGLSLTVAFTFGATLLTQAAAFADMHRWVVGFYSIALVAGLIAAVLAIVSLFLAEQKQVNERAVFHPETLKDADRVIVDEEKEGLMAYRKSLILHLWEIRQRYDDTYRRKAKLVKAGQWAFLGFLGALLLLCIPIVVAVISKGNERSGTKGPDSPSAAEAHQRGTRTGEGNVAPRFEGHAAQAAARSTEAAGSAEATTKGQVSAEAQGSNRPAVAAPGVGSASEGHD